VRLSHVDEEIRRGECDVGALVKKHSIYPVALRLSLGHRALFSFLTTHFEKLTNDSLSLCNDFKKILYTQDIFSKDCLNLC
jgi:hypothetical protein